VPVNFPGLPRLTPYQTEMIVMHMLRGDRELTRQGMTDRLVDSIAIFGSLEECRERIAAYVAAGADMIFAEALKTLDEYRQFAARLGCPVLANITEFGQTPLFTVAELASAAMLAGRAASAHAATAWAKARNSSPRATKSVSQLTSRSAAA